MTLPKPAEQSAVNPVTNCLNNPILQKEIYPLLYANQRICVSNISGASIFFNEQHSYFTSKLLLDANGKKKIPNMSFNQSDTINDKGQE